MPLIELQQKIANQKITQLVFTNEFQYFILIYTKSAWKNLHFVEFEFHRAWKPRVRTKIEFNENECFEFKLEFRYKVS